MQLQLRRSQADEAGAAVDGNVGWAGVQIWCAGEAAVAARPARGECLLCSAILCEVEGEAVQAPAAAAVVAGDARELGAA
eukprot:1138674-Pelagomonas_calceolata.AAC.2